MTATRRNFFSWTRNALAATGLVSTAPVVAEAAVASISVEFMLKVSRAADSRGMAPGEFTAGLVRRFSWRAGEAEHRALARAMDGAQTPILAGLRHIVEVMMAETNLASLARGRCQADVHDAERCARL